MHCLCWRSTKATLKRKTLTHARTRLPPKKLPLMILDCSVALIVQIHLQQNRTDLAVKEVQAARKWAQDSLLVNIAESWVGLRVVQNLTKSASPIEY